MLRVVFFGMDLRILDELRRCPVHIVGVYLPPAPYQLLPKLPVFLRYLIKGFARKRYQTTLVYMALSRFIFEHHLPVMPGTRVNTPAFIHTFKKFAPDLGVVANFGQIMGSDLISVPAYGLINYHPSLLPRYRGPTPLGHILLNNETVGGATWHQLAPGTDSGDILVQKEFTISDCDTIKDLDRKSVQLATATLCPLIQQIAQHKIKPVPQDESRASYYSKLTQQQIAQLDVIGKLG